MCFCSTGAPQGTILAPFLFTLHTSDFRHNSESYHIQKYSDDTAIVACVSGGQKGDYRDTVEAFTDCSKKNTTKTKEFVVNVWRAKTLCQLVCIDREEKESVQIYKYLGWTANRDAV